MSKRFSSVMRVWVQYGLFLMKRGKTHQARSTLQRSLKSLTKSERESLSSSSGGDCLVIMSCCTCTDVNVISRFAQFEFKYGEAERGRTMFESILSSYPRRVDIWSVFIDMVLKVEGDHKQVR